MVLNKIYNEDCLITMKGMDDDSIDCIITDPPYNAKDIGPNKRVYSLGQMQLPEEEYKEFCRKWFVEAARISKRIIFTPGISNICFYPQPYWVICWHKPAAVSFNRMGGFNAWEPIFVYGKMPKGKKIGQDYYLCNTLNFAKGIEADHPCPKPLKFMQWIVHNFSNEGELIYDPFMGSGTTAIAALKYKRNYLGSEINPAYCEMIEKRIKIHLSQTSLSFSQ